MKESQLADGRGGGTHSLEGEGVGQRGLKYTEHKPFGRRYLDVTHSTMSSAVG